MIGASVGTIRRTVVRRNFSRTIALSSDIHTDMRERTSAFRSVFHRPMVLKTRWSLSTAGSLGSATTGATTARAASTMRSMTASSSACLESK